MTKRLIPLFVVLFAIANAACGEPKGQGENAVVSTTNDDINSASRPLRVVSRFRGFAWLPNKDMLFTERPGA